MKKTDFNNKTAVIVCHDSVFGPPHELRDYLLRHNIRKLLFIGHVNRYLPNNPVFSSYVEVYKQGKLVEKVNAKKTSFSESLGYIHDIVLTYYWFIKYMSGKTTYFIGLGNLNSFVGLLGKVVGTVRYSIYYVIDYSPNRFKNIVMNSIFHILDYLCARFSSITWNYAKGMVIAREKIWKIKFPHQVVLPNGITIKDHLPGYSMKNKHELVYIGTLTKHQGIMFILRAMKKLLNHIPDLHFTIIGMGQMREQIEEYCKQHGLQKSVCLTGFVPDPYEADKIISKAALGVAMYVPKDWFIEYTEPGKIKRYLSCSVPVIMTPVSLIANDLEKYKCGFSCSYKMKDFITTVSTYLQNPKKIRLYRKNALEYAKQFRWERIYTEGFHLLSLEL